MADADGLSRPRASMREADVPEDLAHQGLVQGAAGDAHVPKDAIDLWLPRIFSSDMVLQRGLSVPIWGSAGRGAKVEVRFAGLERRTFADIDGRWELRLPLGDASDVGRVLTIVAEDGKQEMSFNNVVVGDVWICAGQSNMEFMLKNAHNGEAAMAEAADYPSVRVFQVQRGMSKTAQKDVPGGEWHASSREAVRAFSAVGYFFGRKLHRESGFPIGLVAVHWGGSRIEPWIPASGFRGAPALKANAVPDASAAEKAVSEDRPEMVEPPKHFGPRDYQDETAICNAMLAGLVPFGVRGVIWYQGESNAEDKLRYFPKLRALICGWRELWNQPDLPILFYVVQLANFSGAKNWGLVREAQRRVLSLPHTGLVVAIDIGEPGNVHPRNKLDVGERLALWARRDTLGQDIVVSGPLASRAEVHDGQVCITFDHFGAGLMIAVRDKMGAIAEVQGGELGLFMVAGEDNSFKLARAAIAGNTVLVSADAVPAPKLVRYACLSNPEGNMLYNRNGLPASPFQLRCL